MESIKLLRTKGDPLEKIICKDLDALHQVLIPYSEVWASHILPRRIGDGSVVEEAWMPFAGCHYTALVRLHHAYVAKETIKRICAEGASSYEQVLQIHYHCCAFWNCLGASIDNFVHARATARKVMEQAVEKRREPPICGKCGQRLAQEEKFSARTLSSKANPNLSYAFERRHQFIHSMIVPKRLDSGMVVFNLRHYDDASTDWRKDVELWDNIDSRIEKDWNSIIEEYSSTWYGLFSDLQAGDKARPTTFDRVVFAPTAPSMSTERISLGTSPQQSSYDNIVPASGTGVSGCDIPPSGNGLNPNS